MKGEWSGEEPKYDVEQLNGIKSGIDGIISMHKQLQFEIRRGEQVWVIELQHVMVVTPIQKKWRLLDIAQQKKPLSYLQNLNTAWHIRDVHKNCIYIF